MPNLPELGIDYDSIERDAEVSLGIGGYYLNESRGHRDDGPEIPLMAAATAFRRAGSHYLLLNKKAESRKAFGKAARAYDEAGNAYGYALLALSSDTIELRSPNEYLDESVAQIKSATERSEGLSGRLNPRPDPRGRVFASMAVAAERRHRQRVEASGRIPDQGRFEALRFKPYGILGQPLSNFVRIATLAASIPVESTRGNDMYKDDQLRRKANQALRPMVMLYRRAFEQARSKEHLWRYLRMPFHPAEPDIIGPLAMVSAPLSEAGVNLGTLIYDSDARDFGESSTDIADRLLHDLL